MNDNKYQSENRQLIEKTKKLERQIKFLAFGLLITISFSVFFNPFWSVKSEDKLKSLTLNRLAIVDENGVERVVIAAPVPDPITLGKRFSRGGKMSGILLFDEEGNERSGYVTANGYPNVLFTLDSIARQQVLFMTEPHGSTALWIWDQNSNSFQLNVSGESPKIKLIKDGQETLIQPEDKKQEK